MFCMQSYEKGPYRILFGRIYAIHTAPIGALCLTYMLHQSVICIEFIREFNY